MKYLFLSILTLFLSCSEMKELEVEKSIQNHIAKINNEDIRSLIKLEIINWKKNNLKQCYGLYNTNNSNFEVDNLVIFNTTKNKLYTTLNISHREWKSSESDGIKQLYGVKILDKWHIYKGASLYLPRGLYKYDKHEPLTFDELSYIAHKEFFGKFIDFDRNGNLIVDNEQLERAINVDDICGYHFSRNNTEEEGFLACTEHKYSEKLDLEEYAEIKEEMEASVRPTDYEIEKLNWWDKLKGKKEPIFETKAWKEFVKEKNSQ